MKKRRSAYRTLYIIDIDTRIAAHFPYEIDPMSR